MLLKKSSPPRNSTRPKATSSRNMSNEVVRSKNVAHEPARSARNETAASVDEVPPQAPRDAIEDECGCLLNVLGAIHCMSVGIVSETESPVPEFSAAFALLEREDSYEQGTEAHWRSPTAHISQDRFCATTIDAGHRARAR
jgi:hypothetical protein